MISFLRYWLPLLIWMAVIFSASADAQSTAHTSRFLEPLLRWFWPDVSPEKIEQVRWAVRKAAHLTEFAILAWLWWRALQRPNGRDSKPWSWRIAGCALGAVILYAMSDELHQYFVANRTASVRDVGIDTLGGITGLGLLWMFYRKRA
ncbi:MAG TPA: VanZ family protein [Verrucomicrobiae bacterium]|jgi:VanZ family protein